MKATTESYVMGLILSAACTLLAFGLVWLHLVSHHAFPTHTFLASMLAVLALAQLAVQMVFFLHLGRDTKRWNLIILVVAVAIVVLILGGSLWIMNNLMHDHGTTPMFNGAPSPQTSLD